MRLAFLSMRAVQFFFYTVAIYLYIYMYMYMYVCIYIYIYIYTQSVTQSIVFAWHNVSIAPLLTFLQCAASVANEESRLWRHCWPPKCLYALIYQTERLTMTLCSLLECKINQRNTMKCVLNVHTWNFNPDTVIRMLSECVKDLCINICIYLFISQHCITICPQ